MRIVVHNLRVGFATNSSSTHSIVLLPPNLAGRFRNKDAYSDEHYGWDRFVLATPEAKCRYLAAQFIGECWENRESRAALIEHFKEFVPDLDYPDVLESDEAPLSVDHQSRLNFPNDVTLIENMIRLMQSDRVLILGGNDNGDEPDIPEGAQPIEALRELRWSHGETRVRTEGRFCVIFDKDSGRKIRFSFEAAENDDIKSVYTKSGAPELVDLKITNFCDAKKRGLSCADFCYQGSTEKGKHASFETIEGIARTLAEAGVFEVAIGGGEPTSHPRFADILKMIREQGIVANFTTATTAWLDDETIRKAVEDHVGGVGFSVHTVSDLDGAREIKAKVRKNNWGTIRVMAQHVVGSVPLAETASIIRECAMGRNRMPLLLLGYKETGFGKNYARFDGDNADIYLRLGLSDIDLSWMDLSVDTALVQQHPTLMQALKVPNALVCPREGAFSCYVDGVTGKMGASSYVPTRTMKKLPADKDGFLSLFGTY